MKLLNRPNLVLFALLLVATAAQQATAATYCVATGNQLAAALTSATWNEEADEIKIEYGTLTSNAQAPKDFQWKFDGRNEDYNLTISGGWSKGNGCVSIATNSPDATVLDAQWAGPVFAADLTYDFNAALTIRNLTFARGQVYAPHPDPAESFCKGAGNTNLQCATGLTVQAMSGSGQVVIDNVLITSGRAQAGARADIVNLSHRDGGSIKMRNSIIMGNDLSGGEITQGVSVSTLTNSLAYLSNNSIFNNSVTSEEVGLIVRNVATVSNNAVANNSSTAINAIQFSSYQAPLQTLRNNHFGSRVYRDGQPFSEIATTTGDAQWTQSGIRMVPNAESVLRDSGDNTPTGGIPSIDFSGNARIINGVIDRGAVEAAAVPPIGPSVTPDSPSSGSTTLVYGVDGAFANRIVTFSVSGGNLGGTTTLFCDGIIGAAQVTINGSQTISTGGSAGAVTVTLPITASPVTHTVGCSASRSNGPVSTYFLYFRVAPDQILSDGFETGP